MFKKIAILLLTGSFLITGLGQPAVAQNTLPKETLDRINNYLDVEKAKYGIIGHSVAILKNGTLVYIGAGGLANLEFNVKATEKTVYQVFSLAKLFVHVTMMQLVESKKIQLDAPIGRYLSEIPDTWKQISVRQVMSHISGLPEYYRWPNPTPKTSLDALQSVANKALEFKTGSATRYNQTNYLLLKMIIEEVTGLDFLSVVTTRMIDKIKLENTRYGGEYAVIPGRATTYRSTPTGLRRNGPIDQPDYMFASSGLNSTAFDLALWFGALLKGKFISPETMESMWQPLNLDDGTVAGFANGWEYSRYDGITAVGHGGGNRADVRHYFRESDNENVTIIYLTNGAEKDFWPGNVSAGLADIILSGVHPSQN
jgi:CubicO group peptidase (beta-lactamase class C family)